MLKCSTRRQHAFVLRVACMHIMLPPSDCHLLLLLVSQSTESIVPEVRYWITYYEILEEAESNSTAVLPSHLSGELSQVC